MLVPGPTPSLLSGCTVARSRPNTRVPLRPEKVQLSGWPPKGAWYTRADAVAMIFALAGSKEVMERLKSVDRLEEEEVREGIVACRQKYVQK